MRYHEIIDERIIVEQAFPLKDIRTRLMVLNDQINEHLLLILSCDEQTPYIHHWKSEILSFLTKIFNMKVAIKGTPYIPRKLFLDYMWKGPFEGHAIETISDMLSQLYQDKPSVNRNNKSAKVLAEEVYMFHQNASVIIEQHGDIRSLIQSL